MAAADDILGVLSQVTIVYLPKAGGSRTIQGLIEYLGPSLMAGVAGGSRPRMELLVRNDTTYGISSREIDTGGDKVQIPLRRGRSVRTVRIVELLAQDRAMLRVLVY